jgi:cytidylate kinase
MSSAKDQSPTEVTPEGAASAPRKMVIAIDGPAGSGKSTLAALLARKYGYVNIESGAMYRALALKAIETGASLDDGPALAALAQASQIELQSRPEGNRVVLDRRDVTDRVRQQDVTDGASKVSVHPLVREWMVAHQRAMGEGGGIVMEGRDIGTKVFPGAEVKIFLDAEPEIRGSRRFQQHPAAEEHATTVLVELHKRDHRDRTRASSPLEPAPDAVHIDSTHLTLDQVAERACEIVDAKRAELKSK